ncbi:MAG: hypothetical protein A2045_06145 [Rhodocyclales bacterium GWA2_65_20]|nr:MAG: hypothetical protein A2045_06145 [Rhodocyclales bacterium GWA2_65_20]
MGQNHVATSGDTGRISLPDRFDAISTLAFRMPFARLLSDARTQRLVVDFSELTYLDSIGIGTLMAWERNCREMGKALVLDKCDARTVSLFKLLGVERMFAFSRQAS